MHLIIAIPTRLIRWVAGIAIDRRSVRLAMPSRLASA